MKFQVADINPLEFLIMRNMLVKTNHFLSLPARAILSVEPMKKYVGLERFMADKYPGRPTGEYFAVVGKESLNLFDSAPDGEYYLFKLDAIESPEGAYFIGINFDWKNAFFSRAIMNTIRKDIVWAVGPCELVFPSVDNPETPRHDLLMYNFSTLAESAIFNVGYVSPDNTILTPSGQVDLGLDLSNIEKREIAPELPHPFPHMGLDF